MVHFTAAVYKSALLTLGVPPGGHHPPPRSSKKDSWSKVAGRVQGDDRVSCVSNCRRSRLASRVRQYSPRTPLSASNRIMLRQSHCRLGSSLKGGEAPLDSLSASACSQRKDLGHSPVFAIGPRAVWDSPAASCRPLASSPRLRCRSPRPAPPVLVQFCCPCLWSSPSPCCPGLCPDSPVALPCSLSLSVCLRLRQSPLFLSGWPLSSSPPPPFPVS